MKTKHYFKWGENGGRQEQQLVKSEREAADKSLALMIASQYWIIMEE